MSLGIHVGKDGQKMHVAIDGALKYLSQKDANITSVQIFVTGPHTTKETLSDIEKKSIKQKVDETGLKVVIHGAYVGSPWNPDSKNGASNVIKELKIAREIGAFGVIIHLSSYTNDTLEDILTEIANARDENDHPLLYNDDIKSPAPVMLILEINHARPTPKTFETPEKLGALFQRVLDWKDQFGKDVKIGLCVDTAHLWSCGEDLSSYDKASQWLLDLPECDLVMFHLNDSNRLLGSGADNHAPLMHGNIWSKYHPRKGSKDPKKCGLNAILEFVEETNSVVILERAWEDIPKDIEILKYFGYFHLEDSK